jgi:hypothetical protein
VYGLLEKDPEQRYQDAAHVIAHLRVAIEAASAPEHPVAERLKRDRMEQKRAEHFARVRGASQIDPEEQEAATPLPARRRDPNETAPLPPGFVPRSPFAVQGPLRRSTLELPPGYAPPSWSPYAQRSPAYSSPDAGLPAHVYPPSSTSWDGAPASTPSWGAALLGPTAPLPRAAPSSNLTPGPIAVPQSYVPGAPHAGAPTRPEETRALRVGAALFGVSLSVAAVTLGATAVPKLKARASSAPPAPTGSAATTAVEGSSAAPIASASATVPAAATSAPMMSAAATSAPITPPRPAVPIVTAAPMTRAVASTKGPEQASPRAKKDAPVKLNEPPKRSGRLFGMDE